MDWLSSIDERLIPGTAPTDVDEASIRTNLKRKGIDLDDEPRMPIEIDLTNREGSARTRMASRA